MPLNIIDRGDKREVHIYLYEREFDVLDHACARYRCSRAAIIGALLDDYAANEAADLTGKVPDSGTDEVPARRPKSRRAR